MKKNDTIQVFTYQRNGDSIIWDRSSVKEMTVTRVMNKATIANTIFAVDKQGKSRVFGCIRQYKYYCFDSTETSKYHIIVATDDLVYSNFINNKIKALKEAESRFKDIITTYNSLSHAKRLDFLDEAEMLISKLK